uniref:Uncharacterized protein n=1 Tax=Timema poppense TaxID=170557 RepID=A0A7R9DJX7_TIMPO|nr:unnamed protein product [Timema poppensis]
MPLLIPLSYRGYTESVIHLLSAIWILEGRLQSLHSELECTKQREGKLSEDNRLLGEKVSTLEKECAGLGLKLKAAENRLEQELRAHEETERRSLVSKEEANLEVVKGLMADGKLGYALVCFDLELMPEMVNISRVIF